MRRALAGPSAVEDPPVRSPRPLAVVAQARRHLRIYSRELDPGLLDNAAVLGALRRFATRNSGGEVRILLQDAATPQHTQAPLLTLAQRLPSVFAFREVREPVDKAYASAFVANDAGGYYFRTLGHRFDGETDLDGAGRARQLRDEFGRVWERARPCTEFRALGI